MKPPKPETLREMYDGRYGSYMELLSPQSRLPLRKGRNQGGEMNVREIVAKYLKDNGYDGLAGYACSCDLDDLFPYGCGEYDCVPGKKVLCTPDTKPSIDECDWYIEEAE